MAVTPPAAFSFGACMSLNLVVVVGFVAGWGILIVLWVKHERRIQRLEHRLEKAVGPWKT